MLRNYQRRLDQRAQLLKGEWLGQIVKSAAFQRNDRIFRTAICGDHGHGKIRTIRGYVSHEIYALSIRKPHVGQAQIEGLLVKQALRLADRSCRLNREPHANQGQFEQFPDIGLVIDHQHTSRTRPARIALSATVHGAICQ